MFQQNPNVQQQPYTPYGVYPQQPQQQQYGYVYGVAKPEARNTQPLTQEQINFLRSDANQFTLAITEKQKLIASCTHKEKNGTSSLIEVTDEKGEKKLKCTICGEVFTLLDLTPEALRSIIDNCKNLLHTIKTLYVDAPVEFIDNYMVIQVLIEKAEQLYNIACANFAKYEGPASPVNPINTGAYANGFTLLAQTLSNPYGAMYGGQPMNGYGQPVYPQPGMPMNGYGQPVYPQPGMPMNGYGQPVYPQQPQVAGYENPMAYGVPGQAAPAPQPAAPAVGTMPASQEAAPAATTVQQPVPEVQQQQVFNV